ncbi:Mdm33 family-domain-containing protein [Macrophomina phaseolina]|uniref:Sensitive to high expression protein 9, mitochondrial n=1 Tax=Macrophomina phaseolina TaxID=35725 RepID=A0ABQ8GSL1_9PEZI|nr:Mdm33 family-domain-containing protein [Macrophomina phaseolina]
MRPALQHAARSLTDYAALTFAHARLGAQPSPSVCSQCKLRAFSAAPLPKSRRALPSIASAAIRQWSSSARSLQQKPPSDPQDPQSPAIEDAAKRASDPSAQQPPELPPSPSESTLPPPTASTSPPAPSTPPRSERVEQVPDEKLPSHRQGLRWEIYKRASAYFDELLPKLILVGQKVNSYTGTDFSGIEALRQEIKQQEQLVKTRRAEVEDAKRQLEAAQAQQQASQKEVVGLLERKHSWAANDLERYMSLIRSEHLNDQAVRSAKDAVMAADRALEEARAHLEKRERAQYHEEQIWSDTIRRNSTWVTIGLMGVNILLLLSQLVAIEPWRRRRLVREIKSALDERAMTPTAPLTGVGPAPTGAADLPHTPVPAYATEDPVEIAEASKGTSPDAMSEEIDEVVEPAGVPLEAVESAEAPVPSSANLSGPEPTIPLPTVDARPYFKDRPNPITPQEKLAAYAENWNLYLHDLFSERSISVRKIDVTTTALQGAAAGAAITCAILLAFLRDN